MANDSANTDAKPGSAPTLPANTAGTKRTFTPEEINDANPTGMQLRQELRSDPHKPDTHIYNPYSWNPEVKAYYDKLATDNGITPPQVFENPIEPGLNAHSYRTREGNPYILATEDIMKSPPDIQKAVLQHELGHVVNDDNDPSKLAAILNNQDSNALSRAKEIKADNFGDHKVQLQGMEALRTKIQNDYLKANPGTTPDDFNRLDAMLGEQGNHPSFTRRIDNLRNLVNGVDTNKIPAGTELIKDMGNTSELQKPGGSPIVMPDPGKWVPVR
jgi:hypothetical protein